MNAKVVFMRRTQKEIDIFGGIVFIDIDGKNIGQLGTDDFIIDLPEGKHKIKMYKSHTYDTYIGFAETEIDIKANENLLIKYAAPMLVNQPGNIIVSNYISQEDIQEIVQKREEKIVLDHIADERKKAELEEKSRNGVIIFVVIMIIIAIIYGIQMASIY